EALMYRLQVMDPVARSRIEEKKANEPPPKDTPAPRPPTLDGKVVGLVWDGMGKGDKTLQGVGEIFREKIPNVDIKFYKGGHPSAPAVLSTAAGECDVIVGGFAD